MNMLTIIYWKFYFSTILRPLVDTIKKRLLAWAAFFFTLKRRRGVGFNCPQIFLYFFRQNVFSFLLTLTVIKDQTILLISLFTDQITSHKHSTLFDSPLKMWPWVWCQLKRRWKNKIFLTNAACIYFGKSPF